MTDEPEYFSTNCGWCQVEVVSFAQPPALVQVATEAHGTGFSRLDRICLECYSELVKLMVARAQLDTSDARKRAWATRRERYGKHGHSAGAYGAIR